jgi:hypothetical protein
MDTAQQSTPSSNELLQQWWSAKSFEGKEFCSLDDDGQLRVAPFHEKVISTLNPLTGDAVMQQFLERFKDFKKQISEFEQEWERSSDKLKLSSKLQKLREYVHQSPAIGNIESLLTQLHTWEQHITQIIEENYKAKKELVASAEQMITTNNNWKEITQKLRDLTEQWKTMGFVDKKRNEALWDQLEAIKAKFFAEKRVHQEDLEKDMLQHLDLKMELVAKAQSLAASEDWKATSEQFKQLLEDWKQIGKTIPEKNEQLWQQFMDAKNQFYDRKKIHTDHIRVEQEANFEKKKAIIDKAELIKNSSDWSITTQAFNDLMNEWKTIGPVPAEHNNALWEQFAAAKEVFFNAKRNQADAYKAMLEDNYQKKTTIIARAEVIKNSNNWRETSEEMNELFEQWKKIGHVGKEHSDTLWEQFLAARKYFFNRKDQDRERRKQHYEKNKELHYNQTKQFLATLEHETADEEAQIEEFKHNLTTISEGPKADALKTHLTALIIEIEHRIKNRANKIADLRAQVKQLEEQQSKPEEHKPAS